MPTPYDRYKRQNIPCLVDVRSGRCKTCNDSKKKCNLRVTFQEFEKLARARRSLSEQVESAEDELEAAEAAVVAAHTKVLQARAKARRLRKQLRSQEQSEDDAYCRELAGIEEVERMEAEASGSAVPSAPEILPEDPSVDQLLASGELLDFPVDEGLDINALLASPVSWGSTTGFMPSSWVGLEVLADGPGDIGEGGPGRPV